MIFKSIVIDQLDGLSPPSRTDKVFFFVNTSDPLPIEVASIEEDSCFEIPSQDVQAKQRIRQLFIDVSFVCNGKTLNDSSGEKKICFWSRILPYIVNFHDL
jgi:hypothetical protein